MVRSLRSGIPGPQTLADVRRSEAYAGRDMERPGGAAAESGLTRAERPRRRYPAAQRGVARAARRRSRRERAHGVRYHEPPPPPPPPPPENPPPEKPEDPDVEGGVEVSVPALAMVNPLMAPENAA
jgi:hypothetical protein